MAIVIYNNQKRNITSWIEALKKCDKDLDLRIYPDVGNKDDITFALTWGYPKGLWGDFKNLKAISSIGAGVNHIINDTTLNSNIKVLKLTDDNLNQSMWEYLLGAVTFYTLNFHTYKNQQKETLWQELANNSFKDTTIGIMGLGSIGKFVATNFSNLGFNVKGYSSSKKDIKDITTYNQDNSIEEFLDGVDILISILPLTQDTRNIFNKNFFSKMKKGSKFINVGRGPQVVEDDLVEALNTKHLNSAFLDVFKKEPIENDHQFWKHPDIYITPHIASVTNPNSVASQIIENYNRVSKGLEPYNTANRIKGY